MRTTRVRVRVKKKKDARNGLIRLALRIERKYYLHFITERSTTSDARRTDQPILYNVPGLCQVIAFVKIPT